MNLNEKKFIKDFKITKEIFINSDKIFYHVQKLNNPKIKYIKTDCIVNRHHHKGLKDGFVKISNFRNMNEIVNLRDLEILITGHSDEPIKDKYLNILNLPNLKLWICENAHVRHEKIYPVPIGITNPIGDINSLHKILSNTDHIFNVSQKPKKNKNLAYMNFTIKNYPGERRGIINKLKDESWITYEEPDISEEGHLNFMENLYNHKFVISPRGNGVDTHRLWETIYLRSIPIVLKHISMEAFYHLPILFIESWDQVNEEFLNKKYEEMHSIKYDYSFTNIEYWYNLIDSYNK